MKKYLLLAALILCSGLLNGASTQAQTNSDTIYACYHKNSGDLRRVTGPGQCKNPEIEISWSRAAVPGPQGPAGPQGDKGEKGERGEQGPSGGFNGMREFLEPGTHVFVVPEGVTHLMLEMWGAGGGGGGGPFEGVTEGGAGGGSGAYTRTVIQVTPGTTYQMVIGAGGVGGAAARWEPPPTNILNPQSGGDGGITFFTDSEGNVLASAPGGGGGAPTAVVQYSGCDGPTPTASGGNLAPASSLGEAIRRSGLDGGASKGARQISFGRACRMEAPGAAGEGAPAPFPAPGLSAGKGGSGGFSGTNGEPGGQGYAIITW